VQRAATPRDDRQENMTRKKYPTLQGFLAIQIYCSIARSTSKTTPLIENRRAKNLVWSASTIL
jgi:hypothetical protein